MKKKYLYCLLFFSIFLIFSCVKKPDNDTSFIKDENINRRVDSLLMLMTLEEKIGQLSQFAGNDDVTGPLVPNNIQTYLDSGYVGSILNVTDVNKMRKIQEYAIHHTKRGIPILFAYDVIHGYKTIFPIPLGETCSWDLDLVRKNASVAAKEAANYGIAWTFAPMLDIARDPRWGRVMESSGEDVYLATLMGIARVKGFQGETTADLAKRNKILACAKHFCAYGAAQAGKDYNSVDISERALREIYLPPFKAAAKEGVATFMTAFNDLSGIPCTANRHLFKDILRKEWNYPGFVVSDYRAVNELVAHGIATNEKEAALLAYEAGVDMDMTGETYLKYMKDWVRKGQIDEKTIDLSVRKILGLKFLLGLFDNPYKYFNDEFSESDKRGILDSVLDAARKSIVLLKNDGVLPLNRNGHKTIALIGPMMKSSVDMNGEWAAIGDRMASVSIYDGLVEHYKNTQVEFLYAQGCELDKAEDRLMNEALSKAQRSDVVLVAMGESYNDCGEAASKTDIRLSASQRELLRKLVSLNKPVVLILLNGRPLDLSWEDKHLNAILEAWYPGTKGGTAVAEIISGVYNPSAKLVMSFPWNAGQIPVYYSYKSTGRPCLENTEKTDYCSFYRDCPNSPLYPFGYGLSYTEYTYSDLRLDKTSLAENDSVTVSVDIKNNGDMEGEEIVQLYVQDLVASVTRPVKELKKFRKIHLQPGEQKTISFQLTLSDLAFYNKDMCWTVEKGEYRIFVGASSIDNRSVVLHHD